MTFDDIKVTRDLRDPQKLGEKLIADICAVRETFDPQAKASQVYDLQTGTYQHANYDDGGVMSNDPAQHHSKTPQRLGDLNDGGLP